MVEKLKTPITEINKSPEISSDKTIKSATEEEIKETPEQARIRIMQKMEAKFDGLFLDWQRMQGELKIIEEQKAKMHPQSEEREGAENLANESDSKTEIHTKNKTGFLSKFQSFKEKLNDSSDIKWLKKQGVEDPEQVVAFRNWCVDNIPYTKWKYDLEDGKKKIKEGGKNVKNIIEKDGQIYFESRHNFGGRTDLKRYAELFKINSQADQIIETLNNQKLLSEWDFVLKEGYPYSDKKDYLKQILEDPRIFQKLEILKRVDLSKILNHKKLPTVGELLEKEEFLSFIQNLNEEKDEDKNTKKEAEDLMVRCLGGIDLESLVGIITDEEKRKLAKQIEGKTLEENEKFYNHQFVGLVENFLTNEENLEILKQVFQLYDIIDFNFRSFDWEFRNSEKIEQEINEKTQGLKLEEIINSPERIEWLKRFCGLFGRKLNLEEVGYIVKKQDYAVQGEVKENKYFWPALGVFMEIGLFDQREDIKKDESYDQARSVRDFFHTFEEFNKTSLGYSHTGYYSGTEKKAENQEGIFDKGFIDFAKRFIKKTRIEANVDFLPFLHKVYKNDNSERFLTRESIAVQAYLKFKTKIGWENIRDHSFQEEFLDMITVSGMLETLRSLDNFFSYEGIDSICNIFSKLIVWHKENDKNSKKEFIDFLQQNVKKGEKLYLRNFEILFESFKLSKEDPENDFFDLKEILDNDLCDFMNWQKDKILALSGEKRSEIFGIWKKMSGWDVGRSLKYKIFGLVLEAENPSGTFEEVEEILEYENVRLSDLVYFDKILGVERERRVDCLEKIKKIGNLGLSNKEIERQFFVDILDGKVDNIDDFIEEVEARQNGIKGMLEITKNFSEITDAGFSSLINEEEQESGLSLTEKREIISDLNDFMDKNHFREKGRTILTLMVARESKEVLAIGEKPEIWTILKEIKETIKKYENILQKGSSDNVPLGIRASIGMEYEITNNKEKSIGKGYFAENYSDYRDDIGNLSKYAKMGQGADGYYEIAFQPTDNPFLVILELKLLQDLDLMDLNFSKYSQAARGYHITLSGEVGMKPEAHTYFLQSILFCANFLGINAGESVANVKGVYEKGTDSNHDPLFSEEKAPMAEFKSFSCDKFEMFERAILTSHNAAIAIQAVNKFTKIDGLEKINQLRNNFPQSSELLYSQLKTNDLLREEIKDLRIKEIIFYWFQLQIKSLNLIEEHNQDFLENETSGYFDEDEGEYIDLKDFSSRKNRTEFENYLARINKIRQEKNQETFSDLNDYFEKELKVSPVVFFEELNNELVNTLTSINNLSLKSGGASKKQRDENKKSEIEFDRANVGSVMHTRIGHKKEYLEGYDDKPEERSVFDRNGKTRKGYYFFQGFSERMITHKTQILLLNFNENMDKIINQKKEAEIKSTDKNEVDDYDFAA